MPKVDDKAELTNSNLGGGTVVEEGRKYVKEWKNNNNKRSHIRPFMCSGGTNLQVLLITSGKQISQ